MCHYLDSRGAAGNERLGGAGEYLQIFIQVANYLPIPLQLQLEVLNTWLFYPQIFPHRMCHYLDSRGAAGNERLGGAGEGARK